MSRLKDLTLVALTMLSLPALAVPADGDPVKYDLKIDKQSLSTALQEFAAQSGIQIIFFAKVTDGHEAPALKGKYTAADAVAHLLDHSDLTFQQLNPKTIEVEPKAATNDLRKNVESPFPGSENALRLAQADPLPPAERSSRFMIKSLVSDFYQAVADHYGDWVPNDPNCYRVENGGPPTPKYGCLGHFEAFDKRIYDAALRRFPLIDEETGVVLCSIIFVHYPGTGGQDTLVHEYIQIRNDKVHAWWTSMYFLPLGSPVSSGWENRHWIWR